MCTLSVFLITIYVIVFQTFRPSTMVCHAHSGFVNSSSNKSQSPRFAHCPILNPQSIKSSLPIQSRVQEWLCITNGISNRSTHTLKYNVGEVNNGEIQMCSSDDKQYDNIQLSSSWGMQFFHSDSFTECICIFSIRLLSGCFHDQTSDIQCQNSEYGLC